MKRMMSFAIVVASMSAWFASDYAIAAENEWSGIVGKIESLNMQRGIVRIDGQAYSLPADVQAWDPVEGGPISQNHLSAGSKVKIHLGSNGAKGKLPVIDKMLLLSAPPK